MKGWVEEEDVRDGWVEGWDGKREEGGDAFLGKRGRKNTCSFVFF